MALDQIMQALTIKTRTMKTTSNMKNITLKQTLLFISLAIFSYTQVSAQKLTVENYQKMTMDSQKKILKQSLAYNDASTAIHALHSIIALEGANSSYKDSLAIVYFQSGAYASSFSLSKELLANKPANGNLLEINAVSIQSLGNVKEAVTAYEKLLTVSKNQYHAYQLAYMQFGIKRLAEAQKTIDFLLTLDGTNTKNIQIAFPSIKDKNKQQNIPLQAAIQNLRGLIAYDLKDTTTAEKAFGEALKIAPEFEYAQQSLKSMNTIKTQSK
jgi:tetratricopeptide (TPR) repeat protein